MYFELILQALLSIGEALNQVQVRVLYVTFRMRGTRSRLTADVELFACNIVDNIVCFFVPRTIYDMQVQVQWGTVKNGFFCEWGLIGGAFCARFFAF